MDEKDKAILKINRSDLIIKFSNEVTEVDLEFCKVNNKLLIIRQSSDDNDYWLSRLPNKIRNSSYSIFILKSSEEMFNKFLDDYILNSNVKDMWIAPAGYNRGNKIGE